MPVLNLEHFACNVSDPAAMAAWYVEHLGMQVVRRVPTPGSRKDHYEAVTNFWRLMQEIMERRFRWNLRQVVATAEEAKRAADEDYRSRPSDREKAEFIDRRLAALGSFFAAVDVGIGAFTKGNAITPEALQKAVPPALSSTRSRPVH